MAPEFWRGITQKIPEKYFACKSSTAGIAKVSHRDLLIYMFTFQRLQQTLKVNGITK